jgi:protein tyrosine phosphatase (PTP) superfamily phosphohydrolase (DUF442 family)
MRRVGVLLLTAGCRCWLTALLATVAFGPELANGQVPRALTDGTNQVRRVPLPGVENSYQLTDRIYSGGQPSGDAAFAALARLGVKTLLSVDGARPDLEAARRHGMRYFHLPVGYDGISTNQAVLLAQAAATLSGPLFIHCHHGKHRGPAAAALICEATSGWTAAQAETWLRTAGTSPDYPGLFRAVREATFPPVAQLAAASNGLPEYAPPRGVVAAMVALDQQWEELLAVQEAGYRAPPQHPDLSPTHVAGRLQQSLHEFARAEETRQRGDGYVKLAQDSEAAATRLTAALQTHLDAPAVAGSSNRLAAAFRAVSQSCTACHREHRNGR